VEVELFGLMSFDVHPIMGIFERTCHILSFPLNFSNFVFCFFLVVPFPSILAPFSSFSMSASNAAGTASLEGKSADKQRHAFSRQAQSKSYQSGETKFSSVGDFPCLKEQSARELIAAFSIGTGDGLKIKRLSTEGKPLSRVLHLINIPDKVNLGHGVTALAIFKDGPTKRDQCGNKNFLITSDVNRITTTATTRASYLATGKFPPNCLLCFHDIDDNQLSIVLKDSTQRNEVAYFFSEMFKLKVNDTNIPNIRGVIGGGEWTDINNIEESVEASLYEELYYSEGREGSASDPARSGDQKKSNEEGSLVSGLSGNLAPGDTADDDTVAMLTKRLEESQMQIEELRDQASRSITVAEAAIVSAEAPGKDGKTPEKDWVETITYQAAEAAAKAQRRQLILGKEKDRALRKIAALKAELAESQIERAKAELHRKETVDQVRVGY